MGERRIRHVVHVVGLSSDSRVVYFVLVYSMICGELHDTHVVAFSSNKRVIYLACSGLTPLICCSRLMSIFQNIPKDDRHELIKCKEYLKESEARRGELDLRIDANRAALFILRKNGERNVERYASFLHGMDRDRV